MLNTRSTTNTLSDAASENHPGAAVDPDPPLPIAINYRAFLVMILAFDIPTFHASLATRAEDSVFELKTAVPVWEAVRNLASVLLAALVATSFKESTQVNPICWFFIAASVLQASMALICSTIFIVFFSSDRHEYIFVDVGGLRFLCWIVWDHFSLPGTCSVWSILMLMVALGVDAIWSNTNQSNCPDQGTCENHFTVAGIMLSLMMCFAAMRFGFFMLHLRRISQALGQSELLA